MTASNSSTTRHLGAMAYKSVSLASVFLQSLSQRMEEPEEPVYQSHQITSGTYLTLTICADSAKETAS